MIVALTFSICGKMTGINTCSHSMTAVALQEFTGTCLQSFVSDL